MDKYASVVSYLGILLDRYMRNLNFMWQDLFPKNLMHFLNFIKNGIIV